MTKFLLEKLEEKELNNGDIMEYYSSEDLEKRIDELNLENSSLLIKYADLIIKHDELLEENKDLKKEINYLKALLDENQVNY